MGHAKHPPYHRQSAIEHLALFLQNEGWFRNLPRAGAGEQVALGHNLLRTSAPANPCTSAGKLKKP